MNDSLRKALLSFPPLVAAVFAVGMLTLSMTFGPSSRADEPAGAPAMARVLVQGPDIPALHRAVDEVGGTVSRTLRLMRAVAAQVPAHRLGDLERSESVERIYHDRKVSTSTVADRGRGVEEDARPRPRPTPSSSAAS